MATDAARAGRKTSDTSSRAAPCSRYRIVARAPQQSERAATRRGQEQAEARRVRRRPARSVRTSLISPVRLSRCFRVASLCFPRNSTQKDTGTALRLGRATTRVRSDERIQRKRGTGEEVRTRLSPGRAKGMQMQGKGTRTRGRVDGSRENGRRGKVCGGLNLGRSTEDDDDALRP